MRPSSFCAGLAAAVICICAAAPAAEARVVKAITAPLGFNGASEFPVYKDLGVGIYQHTLRWNLAASNRPKNPTDPDDPAYEWYPEGDQAIEGARAHGMRTLFLVMDTPPWANGGKGAEYAPRDPRDYANFLRAATRRFPSVRLWQIWGEPTRGPNWQPQDVKKTPRRYARLLDAAYSALKSRSSKNIVIGGNSYTAGEGGVKPVPWVRNMRLPDGRPPRMDLYGHNPFTMREPNLRNKPLAGGNADFSDLDWFNRHVDRYLAKRGRRHLRLFLGEFTVPSAANDREFGYWVTPKTQAKWIDSGFRVARQVGAYAFGWIPLRDEPATGGESLERHTGLIFRDGTKKPGYFAFKRGR